MGMSRWAPRKIDACRYTLFLSWMRVVINVSGLPRLFEQPGLNPPTILQLNLGSSEFSWHHLSLRLRCKKHQSNNQHLILVFKPKKNRNTPINSEVFVVSPWKDGSHKTPAPRPGFTVSIPGRLPIWWTPSIKVGDGWGWYFLLFLGLHFC